MNLPCSRASLLLTGLASAALVGPLRSSLQPPSPGILQRIAELESLLEYVQNENGDLVFDGANLQLSNGSADGSANGLGNVYLGYAEGTFGNGSHNLILGRGQRVEGSGSLIGGRSNESWEDATLVLGETGVADALGASLLGSLDSDATAPFSLVASGFRAKAQGEDSLAAGAFSRAEGVGSSSTANTGRAQGAYSSVLAGLENSASGTHSTVIAGVENVAQGPHSAVLSGEGNVAKGPGSLIAGGWLQTTETSAAESVLVGGGNLVEGIRGVVVGGSMNLVTAPHGVVVGGRQGQSNAPESVVAGGRNCFTAHPRSVVSGGSTRTSFGEHSWTAGSLQEAN